MTIAETNMPEAVSESRATREKASGSSFYAAMRLMPRAEREAMFAIYAFCRAVDDIADDGRGTRAERHAQLEKWRSDLAALYAGAPTGNIVFLADAVARYGLRQSDFLTVIDGMDMDVAQNISAPDLSTLDLYCERVASAVGRLSIKVFGMEEGPGFQLAQHLGRALQLTNILRDLDEDAAVGRLYLPREYLVEAGIESIDPSLVINDPRVDKAARATAALAHRYYANAALILAKKPKGRLRTPRLMGAVYSEILRRTEAAGWMPPRRRVNLRKSELLAIVLRHGLFG